MDVPPRVACLDTRHPRRLLAPEQVPMRFSIYDRPSISSRLSTPSDMRAQGAGLRSSFALWQLHRDALVDSVCYFEHKCTTQHTTAEQSRSFLEGMSWKQRATTGSLRGRMGTSSRHSQEGYRSRASCDWPKRTSAT